MPELELDVEEYAHGGSPLESTDPEQASPHAGFARRPLTSKTPRGDGSLVVTEPSIPAASSLMPFRLPEAPDTAVHDVCGHALRDHWRSADGFAICPSHVTLDLAYSVAGCCPMGCGETLIFVVDRITCGGPHCPQPLAADRILSDPETEHVVQFDEDSFTIRHPLRERLDDALLSCGLHALCADGPPGKLGRYRATEDGVTGWRFTDWTPR